MEDLAQILSKHYLYIFIYQQIMDNSQQFVQHIEQQMIRSTKEHIDKQTQRLINYFGEQFKYTDPLNLIGKRFKDKEAEFQALKQNNNQLFIKTRNLTEEIQKLRVSLNKSRYDEMHISLDKTEKMQNMSSSKLIGRTFVSGNSEIMQKIEQVNKNIDIARQDYAGYAQEYDQLLQYLFSYISRQKNVQKLQSEIMNIQQQSRQDNNEERILVPRKRYDKLIQIYAINMADITVNEFRKQIGSSKSSVGVEFQKKAVNYEQQSKRLYKQKYSDIAKDQNIDTKDLYLLFRALARKVGLERQWQRYHLNNTNQAVQLKSKIQHIFRQNKQIDAGIKDGDNGGQVPLKDRQLVQKIHKVVSQIPMRKVQRQQWLSLKAKIDEDILINIEKVAQKFKQTIKLQDNQIIEKVSLVINTSITKSLQSFSKLIETRLRTKVPKPIQRFEEIAADNLKKAIEAKVQPSKDIWTAFGEVARQKIDQVFKKLTKNIVFISSGVLYQSLVPQN